MFDLCLITNSCVVKNFLKHLFYVICVKCGIICSLVLPDGRLCIERSRNWYAAIFVVVEGGLIQY